MTIRSNYLFYGQVHGKTQNLNPESSKEEAEVMLILWRKPVGWATYKMWKIEEMRHKKIQVHLA